MNIKITLDEEIRAMVTSVTRGVKDRAGLNESIAEELKLGVQDHLIAKYLPRDKYGLKFWERVHDSAAYTSDEKGGEVTLSHLGVTLRYHGGDVTPGKGISSHTGKTTRALSVPTKAVPVKDGVRVPPYRAGILKFIPSKQGNGETVGWLFEGEKRPAKRGKNKGKPIVVQKPGGSLMFTLRTITRHKPDHGVLPDDPRLVQIVTDTALRHLAG